VAFPVDESRVIRLELESVDIGRLICRHELAAALADLAGVDRRAPDVPVAIQRYADALWGRLVQFPQCPTKESAR
jgi:hypothetical protein